MTGEGEGDEVVNLEENVVREMEGMGRTLREMEERNWSPPPPAPVPVGGGDCEGVGHEEGGEGEGEIWCGLAGLEGSMDDGAGEGFDTGGGGVGSSSSGSGDSSVVPSTQQMTVRTEGDVANDLREQEREEHEQEVDYLRSLVNQLTVKERKANDELTTSKDVIRQALMRTSLLQRNFNLRIMGLLDPDVLKRAGVSEYEASDLMGLLQSSWHPMKTEIVEGRDARRVVDDKDEYLQIIKACYGEDVMKDMVRAFSELEEYNPSTRYPILLPWNKQYQRPLNLPEQIHLLLQVIKSLDQENERFRKLIKRAKPIVFTLVFALSLFLLGRTIGTFARHFLEKHSVMATTAAISAASASSAAFLIPSASANPGPGLFSRLKTSIEFIFSYLFGSD